MVQTVEHPTVGPVKLTGPAVKFSETPAVIRCPPPLLGQHSHEVLNEVGRSAVLYLAHSSHHGPLACAAQCWHLVATVQRAQMATGRMMANAQMANAQMANAQTNDGKCRIHNATATCGTDN